MSQSIQSKGGDSSRTPKSKAPQPHSEREEDIDQVELERQQRLEEEKQQYQIKADERIQELFSDQNKMDIHVFGATEIDLFAMETRARKHLHNLVHPILGQIESERQKRAEMEAFYDKLMSRVQKLEDVAGASNNKPQIIVDLETKISEVRSKEMYDVELIQGKLNQTLSRQETLDTAVDEMKAQNKIMDRTFTLREEQMKEVLQKNIDIKNDLIEACEKVYARIEQVHDDIQEKLQGFEVTTSKSSEKIHNYSLIVNKNESDIQELKSYTSTNRNRLNKLEQAKVDNDKYDEFIEEQEKKLETLRLGIKDNFSQIMATDNYLEKYIPFRIQTMVSDNFDSILDQLGQQVPQANSLQKDTSGRDKPTPGDTVQSKQSINKQASAVGGERIYPNVVREEFKEYEKGVFKKLHKVVMVDNGIPNLKKRGFQMPGCRKILTNEERENIKNVLTMIKPDYADGKAEDNSGEGSAEGVREFNPDPNAPQNDKKPNEAPSTQDQDSDVYLPRTDSPPAPHRQADSAQVKKLGLLSQQLDSIESRPKPRDIQGYNILQSKDTVRSKTKNSPTSIKQVGLDDLEPKALAMIEKGYDNSFLVMENFELMKKDFKTMKAEVIQDIEEKVAQLRQETRDTLQMQVSFIEEAVIQNRRQLQCNKDIVRDQELKIEALDQNQTQTQQAISGLNALGSFRGPSPRRRIQSAQKKFINLQIGSPTNQQQQRLNIKELLSYTNSHRNAPIKPTQLDQRPRSLPKDPMQYSDKAMVGWLLEGLKLQNVLNNQIYGMTIQNQMTSNQIMNSILHQYALIEENGGGIRQESSLINGKQTNLSNPMSAQTGEPTMPLQSKLPDPDRPVQNSQMASTQKDINLNADISNTFDVKSVGLQKQSNQESKATGSPGKKDLQKVQRSPHKTGNQNQAAPPKDISFEVKQSADKTELRDSQSEFMRLHNLNIGGGTLQFAASRPAAAGPLAAGNSTFQQKPGEQNGDLIIVGRQSQINASQLSQKGRQQDQGIKVLKSSAQGQMMVPGGAKTSPLKHQTPKRSEHFESTLISQNASSGQRNDDTQELPTDAHPSAKSPASLTPMAPIGSAIDANAANSVQDLKLSQDKAGDATQQPQQDQQQSPEKVTQLGRPATALTNKAGSSTFLPNYNAFNQAQQVSRSQGMTAMAQNPSHQAPKIDIMHVLSLIDRIVEQCEEIKLQNETGTMDTAVVQPTQQTGRSNRTSDRSCIFTNKKLKSRHGNVVEGEKKKNQTRGNSTTVFTNQAADGKNEQPKPHLRGPTPASRPLSPQVLSQSESGQQPNSVAPNFRTITSDRGKGRHAGIIFADQLVGNFSGLNNAMNSTITPQSATTMARTLKHQESLLSKHTTLYRYDQNPHMQTLQQTRFLNNRTLQVAPSPQVDLRMVDPAAIMTPPVNGALEGTLGIQGPPGGAQQRGPPYHSAAKKNVDMKGKDPLRGALPNKM